MIINKGRIVHNTANLPDFLWLFSMESVVIITNLLLTNSTDNSKSLY